MTKQMKMTSQYPRRTKQFGQSMPEYATILAMVTVFCIAALIYFGESLSGFFTDFSGIIQASSTP